jgi:hypothetical protein
MEAESIAPSDTQSVAQSDEQTSSDLPEDSLLGLHIPQADREPAEVGGVQDVADVSMEDGEQLISFESAEGTPTAEKGEGEGGTAGAGSKQREEEEEEEEEEEVIAQGAKRAERTEGTEVTDKTEGTEGTAAAEEEASTDQADVRMA